MLHSLISDHRFPSDQHNENIVPWWSFTKTVLAVAALTLVRDRLIRLDEPVADGPFTLRQLLKHQAGLADYSELKEYHTAVPGGLDPWSADEMMQRLDGMNLRYTPGSGWRYSNVGYMLVARLIERVTGTRIDDALTQRVFQPLGLERVRFVRTPEEFAALCGGVHQPYHPGWVYHGLLVGPLCEASRLLDGLLTGPLLPASLSDQMQEVITLGGPLAGRPWATPGYGLGLMIGRNHSGHLLTGHTGVGPGGAIAVYHCVDGGRSATCAVYGSDEHQVEARVSELLMLQIKT